MKSYAEVEDITELDLDLLKAANKIIDPLPTKIDGQWIRCHELARLVGRALDIPFYDGAYGAMEHSWCGTPDGHILDVYAVGRVPMVQLVVQWPGAPAHYRPKKPRADIDEKIIKRLRRIWLAAS